MKKKFLLTATAFLGLTPVVISTGLSANVNLADGDIVVKKEFEEDYWKQFLKDVEWYTAPSSSYRSSEGWAKKFKFNSAESIYKNVKIEKTEDSGITEWTVSFFLISWC
ncbi:hypothetical protein [Mycoplasmopsis iners]|uniref:hypothetical protein n=1 Tax=Mycoplasmopsis iners TaxID=76630 RepID=UPI0004952E73|nr:hypothetical protein [Mycoplasmopsis iners]